MAKWGEGDPRWIVEERPDATNVNNWHWTEKNAAGWSKDKIKELLEDLKIEHEIGECCIKEVEKMEGDASASNRKGKLIFFYEWDLTLKWEGKAKGEDGEVTGTINIPNLSEENDVGEVEVNVNLKTSGDDADRLKEMMRTFGADVIRCQLDNYISSLKKEFSQGMILPKKPDGVTSANDALSRMNVGSLKQNNVCVSKPVQQGTIGAKIETTTLEMKHCFKCTAEEIYNALTVPEMVQAFTNGPAKIEPKKGGVFELFGGNVHGQFLELVPHSKIVQSWRFRSWPGGHYSTVTFDIEQKADSTDVSLLQTSVPQSDADRTREGWEKYYWEALKRTFGFGSFII